MKNWMNQVADFEAQQIPFVLVTLVECVGSTPQVCGAKAIVTKEGLKAGTVGGGRVEAKAILHAQSLLQESKKACEFLRWNLIRDVGMTCGGIVGFFFEVFQEPLWQIVVFGAGHVSQELVPLLTKLTCQVTCIDDRQEWLDRLPNTPNLKKILTSDAKSFVKDFSDQTFFVLMTQGHRSDLPILHEILTLKDPLFLGVIGSKSKAAVLRKDLRELGVAEEKVRGFHCPIGLPIGDSTPVEIAISVSAQLIQQRDLSLTSDQSRKSVPFHEAVVDDRSL